MSLPTWASVLIALGSAVVVACTADFVLSRLLRTPFNPNGKCCFITGGSTGLGKSLAMQLAAGGADVCIVARREAELKRAAEEIEASRRNESQKVVYISADVTSKEDIVRAFDEAKVKMGRDPEFVCCCAGAAYPKYFLDHTLDDFDNLTRLNYLGQVYTAHQAASRMRDSSIQGKIVFVSSMLGLLSFVGYATYSPTKYAVRGLADTLRNELKRYNIGVHIFFPGGIESPGFDTENMTKPNVTKEIEGANTPQTPDECAKSLLKGVYAGHYMIMTDFISELLRATSRGVAPTNNAILDWAMAILGQPIASGYALYMDYTVKNWKETE
ncbi:3-dehydrosphinganine reductase [Apophysomyces ossiformis]|uniref:3-dehydrosphinganine reductase n=1 Tax=Apophysomyces ossiformis TaxID=679940 RepID=A0A8H7BTD9_9FUNG|nr:3-dehydrosphinganine reductase [Apophysomyces ossiformis]